MKRFMLAASLSLCAAACTFHSNLPLLRLNTHGEPILNEPKIPAQLIVNWDPNASEQTFTATVNFEGLVGIELHGQSSQSNWQKSYGIELGDPSAGSVNAALLGLPSENDWILHAPFNDKSLMRNHLAYSLSAKTGRYAPRTRFVELFVSEYAGTWTENYLGVYVLTEKIKRDQNRVSIQKLNASDITEPDISGGYILKVDKTDPDDIILTTSSNQTTPSLADVKIVLIEPDEPPESQRRWIEAYIRAFESALLSSDFTNPDIGYAQYIDVASFVDYLLLQELMKNVDAYRISAYMYKDRSGKLTMGPVWDFDRSSGNANAPSWLMACSTEGWAVTAAQGNEGFKRPFWWNRLLQDPQFVNRLVARWNFLTRDGVPPFVTEGPFSQVSIEKVIDRAEAEVQRPQRRHFAQWHILGRRVSVNCSIAGSDPARYPVTHAEEVQALRDWLAERLTWISSNISSIGEL